MDKVAKLLRIIPAAEVAKRWGVGAANLQEMLGCDSGNYDDDGDDYELAVYTAPQKRIRPHDGQVVYFCTGPFFGFLKKYGEYVLEGYYFNTDDVETYEKNHPEIVWPVVEEDSSHHPTFSYSALDEDPFANFEPPDPQEEIQPGKVSEELVTNHNENVTPLDRVIPATEVAKRWGLGPENIVAIVRNSGNSLLFYKSPQKRIRPVDGQTMTFYNGPYYTVPGGWGKYNLEGYYFNADDVDAYEKNHPEEVWPVVSEDQTEEESEFLAADDVREELGMSPSQFVDMLNGKKGPRLITSEEDDYLWYWSDNNPNNQISGPGRNYFTTNRLERLPVLLVHRNDLQAYLSERQPLAESAPDASTLKAQLADSLAERDRLSEALEKATARIAELEAATPAYDLAALQERGAQIAALQTEAERVREIINRCGALSAVVKMLEGGNTKEDIARYLKDNGLSYSQVGVLLHDDPLHVGDSAIQQCAKRLLGVAAK